MKIWNSKRRPSPSVVCCCALIVTVVFYCKPSFGQLVTKKAKRTEQVSTLTGPHVLLVDAHPDDEVGSAATIYKITHSLHGLVDLVVITDGQGGFKYSTLAEPIYHHKLTQENIGRKYLPEIRQKEMKAAGKILGMHHIYFFKQFDNHYTLNQHEVLDDTSDVWDLPKVRSQLARILTKGHYDYVFTLLPTDSTHGHHKAATILALQAVQSLPDSVSHPIVLGTSDIDKGKTPATFKGLAGYPITNVTSGAPSYSFDRLQSFGFHHVLNYMIVVNWEIAEHKSQGTTQLGMNQGNLEEFWYFDMNGPNGRNKTKSLFDVLANNTYPELTYPNLK